MSVHRVLLLGAVLAAVGLVFAASDARAQSPQHFTFGYDQPHTTAYGFAGDTFAAKLNELSKGTMIIDQFPGAQLGQEPQMLQKVRTGCRRSAPAISISSSPPPRTPRRWCPRRAFSRSTSSSGARIT